MAIEFEREPREKSITGPLQELATGGFNDRTSSPTQSGEENLEGVDGPVVV